MLTEVYLGGVKYSIFFLALLACKPLPEAVPEIRGGTITNAMLYGDISQHTFTGPAVVTGYDDYETGATEVKMQAEASTGIGMVVFRWKGGNLEDLVPGEYEILPPSEEALETYDPVVLLCSGVEAPWYVYDAPANPAIITVRDSRTARTFEIEAQTEAAFVHAVFQVQ